MRWDVFVVLALLALAVLTARAMEVQTTFTMPGAP